MSKLPCITFNPTQYSLISQTFTDLLFSSKLPQVEIFQYKVFEIVLPTIREQEDLRLLIKLRLKIARDALFRDLVCVMGSVNVFQKGHKREKRKLLSQIFSNHKVVLKKKRKVDRPCGKR